MKWRKRRKFFDNEKIYLTYEEIKALELKDIKDMDQKEAAKEMDISQPTFHRILTLARKKLTYALFNRIPISFEPVCICPNCGFIKKKETSIPCRHISCPNCGIKMKRLY